MRRGDLINDWQDRRTRSAVTAFVVLLMVGLTLGAVLGIGLARAFDLAPLDELRREFSGPDSASATGPR